MSENLPFDVDKIGEVAGEVWQTLDAYGPITLSKLSRLLKHHPRDLVMQGIGWLAREEKILFQQGDQSKTIQLRSESLSAII